MGDTRIEGVPFSAALAAAQSGMPWANAILWREYAAMVLSFARASGAQEPDELTSEVFLTLFDSLSAFRGTESEFRAHVLAIAYRRLTESRRNDARRGSFAILQGLPDDQRAVMVLRIVSDLRIDQIAEVLGSRSWTVKALQRKALEALRSTYSSVPALHRMPA